jgi:hypothetical protein
MRFTAVPIRIGYTAALPYAGPPQAFLCALSGAETGGAETGHTERHGETLQTLDAADEELGIG